VQGANVIVNSGGVYRGEPAGIVAFDVESGAFRWAATDHQASYSSPVAVGGNSGDTVAYFFTRRGLVGLDPVGGDVHFDVYYRPRMEASVNAAAPVWCGGGRLFLSTCYGVGATLFDVSALRGQPREIWAKEGVLDCHYATPVYFDGMLFGFHGRQETGQELRCVDVESGAVVWSDDTFRAGQLIRAGRDLIVLSESGELAVVRAARTGFHLRLRDQVVGRPTRCVPAFSGGSVFLRGPREVVRVDLSAG
jgi:outer membrane protein assembly factor BamB